MAGVAYDVQQLVFVAGVSRAPLCDLCAFACDAYSIRSRRCAASSPAVKVGKDRRRFFELHARDIKYFEHCENGKGVGLKGTIYLFPTTTVMHSGIELVITNPDRKWELLAEDARVCFGWVCAWCCARRMEDGAFLLGRSCNAGMCCSWKEVSQPTHGLTLFFCRRRSGG